MLLGIDTFVEGIMPYYQKQLAELLRIESVSQQPEPIDEQNTVFLDSELRRVVGAVAQIAQSQGFTTTIIDSDVPSPMLVARLEVDPAAPWLMLYNHLDVQPADEPEWRSNPFVPIITENHIIARGATDDKGPMLAALLPLKYLRDTQQLKVNVVGIYETQEENGSKGFEAALRYGLDKGLIPVPDSILATDTIFEGDNPSLTYSLRGLVKATASLQTAEQVVHSGLGGGMVANPLNILVAALSKCYDSFTGEVTFRGIEEGVIQPIGRALEEFSRIASAFDPGRYSGDLGAKTLYTKLGPEEFLDSLWHKPSFEIHEVRRKGAQGTKIPYQAEADITLRLVGRQDPVKVVHYLAAHLKNFHPDIQLNVNDLLPPVETPIDNPFMEKAAAACAYGFGRRAVYVGGSGSIEAISAIRKLFPHAPTVMLALSKASDGYHAPNEKFEWEQARKGMKTIAAYVKGIGELRTR